MKTTLNLLNDSPIYYLNTDYNFFSQSKPLEHGTVACAPMRSRISFNPDKVCGGIYIYNCSTALLYKPGRPLLVKYL